MRSAQEEKSFIIRRLLLTYMTAALILFVDQTSKAYVLGLLGTEEGAYRKVLDDILWIRLVHNTGAAFGMFREASLIFAIAAVLVAVIILLSSRRIAYAPWLVRLALGMELGGAIGNLTDRIRYGHVVDFIDVRIWPFVFNVSDASITIGVVLLLAYLILHSGGEKQSEVKTYEREASN